MATQCTAIGQPPQGARHHPRGPRSPNRSRSKHPGEVGAQRTGSGRRVCKAGGSCPCLATRLKKTWVVADSIESVGGRLHSIFFAGTTSAHCADNGFGLGPDRIHAHFRVDSAVSMGNASSKVRVTKPAISGSLEARGPATFNARMSNELTNSASSAAGMGVSADMPRASVIVTLTPPPRSWSTFAPSMA